MPSPLAAPPPGPVLPQVRATTTLVDPKKLKAEQEKAEAERIRGREKLAEKQHKAMRKFGLPSMPRSRPPQQLNASERAGGCLGCLQCGAAPCTPCSAPVERPAMCCSAGRPPGAGHPARPRWRGSPHLPSPLCAPSGYLEEDEELDEEGLAEELQDSQRQRMLGRPRAYDEAEEEARAARLAAAKSGAPLPGGKRRRIESEDEEEEVAEEEEEDADEMKVGR